MKKFIKRNMKVFVAVVITAVICICGTVYAASQILASDISYKDGTVESALNDLYTKADNQTIEGTVCMLVSGTKNTVGAKYVCNPGDGELRYFYFLSKDDENNTVDLIMDRNLANVTVTWYQLNDYFTSGAGATYRNAWNNVINIGVTKALTINKLIGFVDWNESDGFCLEGNSTYVNWNSSELCPTNTSNYLWLYGDYWLEDVQNSTYAWGVNGNGSVTGNKFNVSRGVRPVITVAKNKLAN